MEIDSPHPIAFRCGEVSECISGIYGTAKPNSRMIYGRPVHTLFTIRNRGEEEEETNVILFGGDTAINHRLIVYRRRRLG